MKFFRNYNMKWWQVSLLKIYVLSIGLMLGAYFPEVFKRGVVILATIFVLLLIYFVRLIISQKI